MTRPFPLLLLALVFIYLGIQLTVTQMWILVLVGFAILTALIIAMSYRNLYRGPKTLADDFRRSAKDFFEDRGGEADRLMAQRREEINDIEEGDFDEVYNVKKVSPEKDD